VIVIKTLKQSLLREFSPFQSTSAGTRAYTKHRIWRLSVPGGWLKKLTASSLSPIGSPRQDLDNNNNNNNNNNDKIYLFVYLSRKNNNESVLFKIFKKKYKTYFKMI
jgi:hypothetical protein